MQKWTGRGGDVKELMCCAFLFIYLISIPPANGFLFYFLEKDYIRYDLYNVGKLDVGLFCREQAIQIRK